MTSLSTSFSTAIRQALTEEMRRDNRIILLGEDIGKYGGAFGVTKGLVNEFGPERVRDTPISEATFVGAALGAALTGLKPVVEIMFADFLAVCMDPIINQISKARYHISKEISKEVDLPIVIRTPTGLVGSAGSQHSQAAESWLIPIPGLKIVFPSTPKDAKGLLKEALRGSDPVIFFEHKLLYRTRGTIPAHDFTIPIGSAKIVRSGTDVTIITAGSMVRETIKASQTLFANGVDVEIIDLRSLVPFDKNKIIASIRKTGKCVIVHEAHLRGGFGAEIAAFISQYAYSYLKAPIMRLGAPNVPVPYSPALETSFTPNEMSISQTVLELSNV